MHASMHFICSLNDGRASPNPSARPGPEPNGTCQTSNTMYLNEGVQLLVHINILHLGCHCDWIAAQLQDQLGMLAPRCAQRGAGRGALSSRDRRGGSYQNLQGLNRKLKVMEKCAA